MIRPAFLIGLFASLICTTAFAGETINAQEVEGYFYADGEMKRSGPQFEITYYVEGDTITRTRGYDLNKKEVIPDNTVYQIQRQLLSDPSKYAKLIRWDTLTVDVMRNTIEAAIASPASLIRNQRALRVRNG